MKVVFFGTAQIAVPSLESLYVENNLEIVAVITQPDKPIGRGQKLTPSPIKVAAENLSLKIFQPKDAEELEKFLKTLPQSDFFVVFAFGMLLSSTILAIPRYGSINVHTSLLPHYRGASPIQESLLSGDQETGVSIVKMTKKLDSGPVFLIRRLEISKTDNLHTLSVKLAKLSAEILPTVLHDIAQDLLSPIPQEDHKATYCRKIEKSDGRIDWQNKSAEQIKNMIRAYTPWPSVYTDLHGKKLKILEAEISNENSGPGEFILKDKVLKIGTKKGTLIPKKVQLEGKNVVDISSFINGNLNYLS